MQKSRSTDRPLVFSIIGTMKSSVVPGGTLGFREITSPFFNPMPIDVATSFTALRSADISSERTGTQIILKYDFLDASIGSSNNSKRLFFKASAYASEIPGSGINVRPSIAALNTFRELSTPITQARALSQAAASGDPT